MTHDLIRELPARTELSKFLNRWVERALHVSGYCTLPRILLPHGTSRNELWPERPERRLRLVSAIARGRRWLDEISSGSATDAAQIALRERCSVRHVNMTISLAFLAPKLVRAAVEGRLPRGINIARLRDAPAEWSRQFEALGLNPQQ